MKISPLNHFAFSAGLAVALAGCGAAQTPTGAPGALPQAAAPAHTIAHHIGGASSYHVLHSFGNGSDGEYPLASLLNVNGTLYGTTEESVYGVGTVFSITTTGKEKVLYRFAGGTSDGAHPAAGLISVNGTLYGTTLYGGPYNGLGCGSESLDCGTVFSVTTAGMEHVIHYFGSGNDGQQPWASLLNVNGTLYGTTLYGGGSGCFGYGCGTIFSVTTAGTEHVLYSFEGKPDGANPYASLIDVKGTGYGTTYGGGRVGYGTVFSITAAGTEHVLHSFKNYPGAADPDASLINVNGKLYGTTYYGGVYSEGCYPVQGCGTVFSITPGGTKHLLHSFGNGSDGYYPSAGLINVNGRLYGTTSYGGAYGEGTIFAITRGGAEHLLHSFGSGSDGSFPMAGLIDVNGKLYGTTSYGGTYGGGTVFALRP